MAKFTELDPAEVAVGRGRSARESMAPYIVAVRESEAGKIELEKGENRGTAKRYLSLAAREVGVRVRSTVVDRENAIYWKRTGASNGSAA